MRRGTFTTGSSPETFTRWPSPRGWNAVVLVSGAIVLVVALALGIGWLASARSSSARYAISAPLRRVDLQLASGQAVIVGTSASTVQVRRTDHFAFGHSAREQRSIRRGVLRISSRCPRIVVGSCSASYELSVPETVSVKVTTTAGHVRLDGFRGPATLQTGSGSVDVEAYCGFKLAALTGSGDMHVATACAPQQLDLRSRSGDVAALVPPGRYRLSAVSGSGRERVSGVVRDSRAPFSIEVRSGSGSAEVEGGL
jgi:DUF4097 and DUF4098 domain-containing protein YvlB